MKLKTKIFGGLLIALIVIQFFQIDKSNPGVVEGRDIRLSAAPPDEVMTLIEDACYDCHSNQTEYPWYTYVQPVGWWIKGHIKGGKKHLNFSEWGSMSNGDQKHAAEEIAEEVEEQHMPLSSYTWLHSEASLSDEQRQVLEEWFEHY